MDQDVQVPEGPESKISIKGFRQSRAFERDGRYIMVFEQIQDL